MFIYWLGTEPFLYIAEPEFLKNMSSGVLGKSWGKPIVFKHDRKPMFGSGLVMVEGDEWVRHRHIITPAFSPTNLKVSFNFSPFPHIIKKKNYSKAPSNTLSVVKVSSVILFIKMHFPQLTASQV